MLAQGLWLFKIKHSAQYTIYHIFWTVRDFFFHFIHYFAYHH